jgi:hypothetical protein
MFDMSNERTSGLVPGGRLDYGLPSGVSHAVRHLEHAAGRFATVQTVDAVRRHPYISWQALS